MRGSAARDEWEKVPWVALSFVAQRLEGHPTARLIHEVHYFVQSHGRLPIRNAVRLLNVQLPPTLSYGFGDAK